MKFENLEKAVVIHRKLENIDKEIFNVGQDGSLFSAVAVIAGYNPDRAKELREEARLLLEAEKQLLFDQLKTLD